MGYFLKLIATLIILNQTVLSHECHHEPNYDIITIQDNGRLGLTEEEQRNLQVSNFRMTYDTTQIQATVTNANHLSLLTKTLEIARIFYQNLIVPVNPFQGTITPVSSAKCPYTFSTAQLAEQVGNTDFHFYIQSESPSADQTWIAKSTPCLKQGGDDRTIMGIITINLNYLSKMSTSNYDFQNYVDVFIHEMFHSLVFSQDLFPLYKNPSNSGSQYVATVDYNIDSSQGSYFVAFPNCVNWAKTYYNCATITSVPLENDGTSGSAGAHWERTILLNDIMTASSLAGDNLWSGLNNALILDSGWYTLRTDSGTFALDDKMMWGKGEGCDFYNNRCSNNKYPEFCTTLKENGNTFTYSGLGFCSNLDSYSQCPYFATYKNQLCFNENLKLDTELGGPLYGSYFSVFQATSRSFKSNLSPQYVDKLADYFAVCYPYTCSTDNKTLTIKVGPRDIVCTSDNQVISNVEGFNGSLTCPRSISNFCYGFQSCPDFCSQRGYCISGKCRCVSGITGLQSSNCECQDGYYVNDSTKACETCGVTNCLRCSASKACTQCTVGYYLLNGNCQKCADNCLDCNSSGACIKCQFGYLKEASSSGCSEASVNSKKLFALTVFTILSILFYV